MMGISRSRKMGKPVFGQYGSGDNERAKADWYPSPLDAVDRLVMNLPPHLMLGNRVMDAGAGDGRLTKPLLRRGHDVVGIELEDRGDDCGGRIIRGDWMQTTAQDLDGFTDIVTNPPFNLSDEFLQHAIAIGQPGIKVHALLRFTWIAAISRQWARDALAHITIAGRLSMLPAGDERLDKGDGGTVDFAWFTLVPPKWNGGITLARAAGISKGKSR